MKPIIFSEMMAKAILDGRKTQTRRVIKPQFKQLWGCGIRNSDPEYYSANVDIKDGDGSWKWLRCPLGKPGNFLWVRETRATSRIVLRVTNIRAQRLQEITEDEAEKEGIETATPFIWQSTTPNKLMSPENIMVADNPIDKFIEVWDRINAQCGFGWAANPWVWVIEFETVETILEV